jgi:tRNA dimethylallyltransferase
MPPPAVLPPVVVVTGPTATGKTALAIALARRFDGEIVNADSMQVYRYMDVGTAKATAEERAEAPHHLLDLVTPDVAYSAGRYAADAREAAARIHAAGRLVVLTGGTGLYIKAFLLGLVDAGAVDPELRADLEREHEEAEASSDPGRLHRRLAAIDAESARTIHPHDAKRVVRALELFESGGRTASQRREAHGFGDRRYRVLHLALDLEREALHRRIDARCQHMLDAGLLREVRDLVDRGYTFDLRPMQAIGYRHMQPVVEGADTLPNALDAMRRDTRRYARRQRTWLRKVPEALWVDAQARDEIADRVEAFLEK